VELARRETARTPCNARAAVCVAPARAHIVAAKNSASRRRRTPERRATTHGPDVRGPRRRRATPLRSDAAQRGATSREAVAQRRRAARADVGNPVDFAAEHPPI
jgi:hypothetical protein